MYLIILTIVIYLCNFCWSLGAHLIDIRYKKAKDCCDCISLSACVCIVHCVLISRHAASFTWAMSAQVSMYCEDPVQTMWWTNKPISQVQVCHWIPFMGSYSCELVFVFLSSFKSSKLLCPWASIDWNAIIYLRKPSNVSCHKAVLLMRTFSSLEKKQQQCNIICEVKLFMYTDH